MHFISFGQHWFSSWLGWIIINRLHSNHINAFWRWIILILIMKIYQKMIFFKFAVQFSKGQWVNPCCIEARIFWEILTILLLLMPWLLPLPSLQQSWYCVCMIKKSFSSQRKNFSYLCHLSAEKWQQIQIWFYVPKIDSAPLGLSPGLREWSREYPLHGILIMHMVDCSLRLATAIHTNYMKH